MSRETWSSLLQTTQDLCVDATTTSTTSISSSDVFLARNINNTIQYLFGLIKNYKTQPLPRTFQTDPDQTDPRFYHYPPGLLSLESVTIATSNDIQQPLRIINSQQTWDRYQEFPQTADFPQYYFPRQYDFGIWPTPSAVRTGTVVGNYLPQKLSIGDYSSGTVTVGQNTITVTGLGTTFTADMVGRWFCQTDSTGIPVGNWYRVSAFSSTTVLTLESYFEEAGLSASNYVIAQSPELPEELHEYIPYRAAAAYFRGPRRDGERAQEYMNYFYTGDDANPNRGGGIKGGVLGVLNEYKNKGRGNSPIATLNHARDSYIPEAWKTTLTEAP